MNDAPVGIEHERLTTDKLMNNCRVWWQQAVQINRLNIEVQTLDAEMPLPTSRTNLSLIAQSDNDARRVNLKSILE